MPKDDKLNNQKPQNQPNKQTNESDMPEDIFMETDKKEIIKPDQDGIGVAENEESQSVLLEEDENKDLFSKDKISTTQKIILIIIAVIVIAALAGGGYLVYKAVNNGEIININTNSNDNQNLNLNLNIQNTNELVNQNTNQPNLNFNPNANTNQHIDTDNDGLTDSKEMEYGTDINNPDTDGDGFTDGDEVLNGYNPLGEGEL